MKSQHTDHGDGTDPIESTDVGARQADLGVADRRCGVPWSRRPLMAARRSGPWGNRSGALSSIAV